MLEKHNETVKQEQVETKQSRYTYTEKYKILLKTKTLNAFDIRQKYNIFDRTLRKWKKKKIRSETLQPKET